MTLLADLQRVIRDVPDFPRPGAVFRDVSPVLRQPALFTRTLDALADPWRGQKIDVVAALEARGFPFGAPMAERLGAALVLVRKASRLPGETVKQRYALEYGEGTMQLPADAIAPKQRVLIVDDLLATGGTAEAAGKLVEHLGGEVAGYQFVIELAALNGSKRLGPRVRALVHY